jgi:histidinol-phosphate/aromatic aminotransferase/cobyric acid decarboxylase-like protein
MNLSGIMNGELYNFLQNIKKFVRPISVPNCIFSKNPCKVKLDANESHTGLRAYIKQEILKTNRYPDPSKVP